MFGSKTCFFFLNWTEALQRNITKKTADKLFAKICVKSVSGGSAYD